MATRYHNTTLRRYEYHIDDEYRDCKFRVFKSDDGVRVYRHKRDPKLSNLLSKPYYEIEGDLYYSYEGGYTVNEIVDLLSRNLI